MNRLDRIEAFLAVEERHEFQWLVTEYPDEPGLRTSDLRLLIDVARGASLLASFGPLEDTHRWNALSSGERAALIQLRDALAPLLAEEEPDK